MYCNCQKDSLGYILVMRLLTTGHLRERNVFCYRNFIRSKNSVKTGRATK